ncbi:MAG: putative DNA binding domain-containing protein [Saprospiraceae bacterium]|nr:putative DNA binding domain-containing protein [Saprospiraceae bacterium]
MHKPIDVFNDPESYIDFLTSPDLERLYGQYFDLKEVVSPYQKDKIQKSILECVSAFANSNKEGGLLILGINDKTREITGTDHLKEEEYNSLTGFAGQQLKHHATRVDACFVNGKRILLFFVPYEPRNICQTNEAHPKAWKREGAKCVQFKREDWYSFENLKNPGDWEKQPCTEYEERFLDMPLFEEFKKSWLADSDIPSGYDIIDVLENAGAIVKHQDVWWFTNAGFLFFCSNPQRLFPSAYVRFLKYEARLQDRPNPGNSTGENEFQGALPTMIRKIRDWVKESNWFRRYTYRADDGFSFIHEDEYPVIAIGEAIVNAVAHRDYALKTPIDCLTYSDAFQVRNAGGILQNQRSLPKRFLLNEVEIRSYPRNERLVSWFKMLRDEDNKPFVLSRGEGTRRIQMEIDRLGLPAPAYQTNGETTVTFFNNIEERSKKFFNVGGPSRSTHEFINLFPIHFTGDLAGYDKAILLKEILGVLKDNLQANGWYVDRYSKGRLTVHPKGASISLGNQAAQKVCSIYQAYILQLRVIDGLFYLAVDYKAELKNMQAVGQLDMALRTELVNRSGIVKYENRWENCFIREVNKEKSVVLLTDYDSEIEIANEWVVPNLSTKQIAQNLEYNDVGFFDIHTKLKEAGLQMLPNAASERAKITMNAARLISSLMPLRFNGFQFSMDAQPTFLMNAPKNPVLDGSFLPLTVFHDLQEPQVSFGDNFRSLNILEGLNKYGAYMNTPRDITIVPVCTIAERQQMADMISRLRTGKYKYEGSERTFGVKFLYETIYTTNSHDEIEGECRRIIEQHPSWEGDPSLSRIFLVSVPGNKFASDDHTSPYFGIKEFLFERGIPCQMLDTPTLQNPDWKDLNLALNMVAKCGLVPWVLSDRLPEADCFIGIAYTTARNSKNREKLMGFVSVFDEYGRWRFYKGDSVFTFDKKKEYFAKLIPDTLKALQNLPSNARIHIHSASRFSKEDKQVILSAARSTMPNARFSLVWLNDTHILRAYDNENVSGSLSRGSYINLSRKKLLLSTTGYNAFKKTLGTPRLIDAEIHADGNTDLRLYAKHILSLTKLNWASTNALVAEPITTKYASNIAYLTEKFIQRKGEFKLHPILEKTPWFI